MVAYAAYVRAGGRLDVFGVSNRLVSERLREVAVGVDEEIKVRTPLEILAVMEGTHDKSPVEPWAVGDSSATGYSLDVPGFRKWLAVGGLLALREVDRIDWRIAVVRRLYGPSHARKVGVELIAGIPVPVGMGPENQLQNVGIADLHDAILIDSSSGSMLATVFPCMIDALYLVIGQQGRQIFKVCAKYAGDDDGNIYTVRRIAD